ncbi:HpcH/HpaI aldolase/citrate lyase family protein [Aestuariimicrobium ganziense]|uniref:HpcH/HpaI aldolase/citrate lyase family protein n=1 Tax=Aestuariimicrobium ganziense TaxID=2773677 RepID=UPI0019411F2C|nr:CoA ester lyase [Aestuariimicrobium ganziense]
MTVDAAQAESRTAPTVEAADGATFGPDLARSWLLVNAFVPQRFVRAQSSPADLVLLDLEDAVAPQNKGAARQHVKEWLEQGHPTWARVNAIDTEHWRADMDLLSSYDNVQGVMLAMVDSPESVKVTQKALPGRKIVALVETARGVQNLSAIAESGSTFRLAFGLGDYRRDTGFADDPHALAYTRSQFTIASRAAGLPGPIDGPAVGALGVALADSAGVTVTFGMTGKICLMPEQCNTVNEILSPSLGDISWALEFLAEFEAEGGEIRNGSDLPRLARANKILALAKAFAMEPPEGYHGFPPPSDTYHY